MDQCSSLVRLEIFENEHLDQLEFPGRDPGLQGWPSGAE